jgi:hypothetical protein
LARAVGLRAAGRVCGVGAVRVFADVGFLLDLLFRLLCGTFEEDPLGRPRGAARFSGGEDARRRAGRFFFEGSAGTAGFFLGFLDFLNETLGERASPTVGSAEGFLDDNARDGRVAFGLVAARDFLTRAMDQRDRLP